MSTQMKANGANQPTKMNGQGKAEQGPVFTVHNIYLKDMSFEAPHSPQIFSDPWKPKMEFDLQTGSYPLSEEESVHEVAIHITLSIKLGEGKEEKVVALIEIHQAGAFTVKGFDEVTFKQVLATTCPTVLFPYAREAISNLATRGGFTQLIVPPINFDAMYAQHLEEEALKAKSETTSS